MPCSRVLLTLAVAGAAQGLALTPAPAAPWPAAEASFAPTRVVERHHHRRHPRAEAGPAGQSRGTGGENGGVDQFGYPDNDPQRPYGANNTVTAPPGTAAYEEQQNNRRYFCDWAPSRC